MIQSFSLLERMGFPDPVCSTLRMLGLRAVAFALLLVCGACSNPQVYPLPSETGAGGADAAGGADSGGVEPSSVVFEPGPDEGFIFEVREVSFGEGQDFGQDSFPEVIFGAPLGGGTSQQSLDVVSLGDGGSITFSFERPVVDGPGVDFIIFENPFAFGNAGEFYTELAEVAVSEDGITFQAFTCKPQTTEGCAGVNPVLFNGLDGGKGPVSASETGGDAFDLSDLGLTEVQAIRITDLKGDDDVFDLDAAMALHLKKPNAQP